MNFIGNIFPERIIYSLGWTIIHSLWLGTIIALMLFAFITLVKSSAELKAKVSVLALGLMLISFLGTFTIEYASYSKGSTVPAYITNSQASTRADANINNNSGGIDFFEPGITAAAKNYLAENIPMLAMIWFAGLIIFTIKFFGGLFLTRKLKFSGTSFVPAVWQNKLNSIRYKLKITKPVRLLESVNICIPIVIGHVKPVILFPLGMLAGLPESQVEAIIAHELAHIYRNDYLINFLQSAGEIILFYHPAAWWISHKIREERENSCDDIAVSVSGDKLTFARALANLEEVKMKSRKFALAAKDRGTLAGRIKRLFETGGNQIGFSEKIFVSIIIMAIILTTSVFASVSLDSPAKAAYVNFAAAAGDSLPVNNNQPTNGNDNHFNINANVNSQDSNTNTNLNSNSNVNVKLNIDPPDSINRKSNKKTEAMKIVPAEPAPPAVPAKANTNTLPPLPGKAPAADSTQLAGLNPLPPLPPAADEDSTVNKESEKDLEVVKKKVVETRKEFYKQQKKVEEYRKQLKQVNEKLKMQENELRIKKEELRRKSEKPRENKEQFMQGLTEELMKRGIVKDENFYMRLTQKELDINDKKQPDELLRTALKLYRQVWGKDIGKNDEMEVGRN